MQKSDCKICRRFGTKLFLKGDRCFTAKCAYLRRAYAPGPKMKKRHGQLSEYGKELMEKQRLRNWYNLNERQFKNYVKRILTKRGKVENASASLISSLEKRLDNVIFRLGFASSRAKAQQMVSHGLFLINGHSIDTPAHEVKKGDTICPRPQKMKKVIFQNLPNLLKNYKTPSWLQLNAEKLEGKVIGEPTLEEAAPPAEVTAIFEFYSR
ncbi:MAG: 30S ribosomal protein S4 [Candidatus Pacebacteria bacterium]|nr:30S ribosomal protein S4 [Candidatus Paceibacterota bacterium]